MPTDTTTSPGTRAARGTRPARARGATAARGPPPPHAPPTEGSRRGRGAADPQERTLPSGDVIVTFRVVVRRPPAKGSGKGSGSRSGAATTEPGGSRATVDTLDVVCWAAGPRRTAGRLEPGDVVEVEGALRRRFFGVAGGRASRYEVEAGRVRRVSGGRRAGT